MKRRNDIQLCACNLPTGEFKVWQAEADNEQLAKKGRQPPAAEMRPAVPKSLLGNHPGTMKLVRPIDWVFLISLGIFAGSCLIVEATGGVGPCGPASSWGIIWLVGYPIGAIGMIVGLVLSLVSAFRKPHPKDNPEGKP